MPPRGISCLAGPLSLTMHTVVERGTAVPPSRQIAAALRDRIASGEYPPGSKLPPIASSRDARGLAEEFGVTVNTIKKSLAILREEGLIESVPGYGTFVAKN
jgi:DNA-binding GntR family transcriptional regulator